MRFQMSIYWIRVSYSCIKFPMPIPVSLLLSIGLNCWPEILNYAMLMLSHAQLNVDLFDGYFMLETDVEMFG